MARNVTVAQLKTRLDTICDIENDTHISAAQKLEAINAGYTKFYDFLVENGLPDHFVKQASITVSAGTTAYLLSSIAADFYKVRRVMVDLGSSQYRTLTPLNEWYIQSYRPPQSGCTVKLDYIPACPVLTADGDQVDGINGWDELIVLYAAEYVKARKDDGLHPALQKEMTQLEARIKKLARRDHQFGEHIIQRMKHKDPYNIYSNNVDAYRVRGLNLELYYYNGYRQL